MSDAVKHYGVKGQKWGVRKEEEIVLRKSLKGGGEVIVTKDKPVGLGRIFPSLNKGAASFTIRDKSNRKVGEASFYHDSPEQLHLEWLGVRKQHRGQGYATAAFEGAVNYAKANGVKRLVLEVPASSKDAQHIYTGFGFKPTGRDDDATKLFGFEMELVLDDVQHARKALMDYILESLDNVKENDMSDAVDSMLAHHGIDVDDEIKHYGKKGMKWGVRKDRPSGDSGTKTGWSDDQKKKAKVVGQVALVAGVAAGAYFASISLQRGGAAREFLSSMAVKGTNATKNDPAKIAEMTRKAAAGRRAAQETLAKHGSKTISMDPSLKKFLADSSKRMFSDQKQWSESLGKSLSQIQAEDAAFIANYIKNLG